MGLVEGEVEEEGLFGRFFFEGLEPADRFIGGDAAGEAFDHADCFAVADVVFWIGVRRAGVVLGGEPVVEAGGIGLGLGGGVEPAIAVPFSGEAGGVAGFFKELGNGDLGGAHVDAAVAGDEVVNAGAVGAATGHEADAGGGADGGGGVEIGEANAVFGHGIQVGCFDVRVAVALEVSVAEVVGEDDDDVGLFSRVLCQEGEGEESEKGDEGPHDFVTVWGLFGFQILLDFWSLQSLLAGAS